MIFLGFYVLKRTNQCKTWRLGKLPECLQQTSTGDGEQVGTWSSFGATTTKIYTENMNGMLHCDVLQNEMKQSLAKIPAQVFEQN